MRALEEEKSPFASGPIKAVIIGNGFKLKNVFEAQSCSAYDPDMPLRQTIHELGSAFSEFFVSCIQEEEKKVGKFQKNENSDLPEGTQMIFYHTGVGRRWFEALEHLILFAEAAVIERRISSPVSVREFYQARNELRTLMADYIQFEYANSYWREPSEDLKAALAKFEDQFWSSQSYFARFIGYLKLMWYAIQDCCKLNISDAGSPVPGQDLPKNQDGEISSNSQRDGFPNPQNDKAPAAP